MQTDKQTVIVTGASSGIGLGLAKAFHAEGFNVVANSRNLTSSGALTASEGMILIDGDVAEPATAKALAPAAVEKFGRIDVLLNNAGIFVPKPFHGYTEEDYRRVTGTNLAGFFLEVKWNATN